MRRAYLGPLLILLLTDLLDARPALAEHMSGGAPDIMAVYGGSAFLLAFVGILLLLGHAPTFLKGRERSFGSLLLLVGFSLLVYGSYQTALIGSPNDALGGEVWGRAASRQIIGTFLAFATASGLALFFGRRSGMLARGEKVKYVVFRNGDPNDADAARPVNRSDDWLALIPLAGMLLVALFFSVGILLVVKPWQ